jgi:hypothetical protein
MLQALLTNIREGRKSVSGTNTLAYWAHSKAQKTMKCYEYGPWSLPIQGGKLKEIALDHKYY